MDLRELARLGLTMRQAQLAYWKLRRSRFDAAMDGIIHGRQGLLSGEESHA